MRNFFTGAIASMALATLLVGSASAADMISSNTLHGYNSAEQDQLQRDDTQHNLRQGLGAGAIVSPGDRTEAASRLDQGSYADGSSAWLDRSPDGQVINQASTPDQAAGLHASQDD